MKLANSQSFWQKIHSRAREKAFPLRVMFELTYRCNFKCPHCYVPQAFRKYKEINKKDVFLIINQLADIGCFYLGFTGGEPFMRKDIMDILWHARKRGFQAIVYTNGSLISEELAKELADMQLNKIDITIPAVKKKNFESITKMPGSFDKVFKAIEALKEHNVPLGFKTCILKDNQDQIEEIIKFSDSQGAEHRLDDMLFCRLDGSVEPYKFRGRMKLGPSSKSKGILLKAKKEACNDKMDSPFDSERILFRCGAGTSQAAITPQGELKLCLMINYPKYKILNKSLDSAWQRLKKLTRLLEKNSDYKCGNCELADYCKWCPAKSWAYNRTFDSCDPQTRLWAKKLKNAKK